MNFDKNFTYLATDLTKKNFHNKKMISGENLASMIETYLLSNPLKIKQYVKELVLKNHLDKLSSLCLGCTHYELIHNMFADFCRKTIIEDNSKHILQKIALPQANELNVVYLMSRQDIAYEKTLKNLTFN